MTAERSGEIVTFYSYKGGTGRTMALANVAWILAANGRRVLAVDWDLEAPGLHRFFGPFLAPGAVADAPGVLNLIMNFAFAVSDAGADGNGRDPAWYERHTALDGYRVPVQWEFPGEGTLDLLPAGHPNRDYASPVSAFDWEHFYGRLDGMEFFEALRRTMKASYDHVLIDSRTGLSDVGDICTIQFPDTVVNCFTMSDQSIDGAALMAQRIVERFQDRAIRILPVPMRLDLTAEQERLDIARDTARVRFDRFLREKRGDDLDRYWRNVEIPYHAYYSYEEILATFGDKAQAPNTVLSSFERLAAEITRGEVRGLPPIPDELRLRYRQAFQRRRPTRPADVFLSYVPEDRAWADWLQELLAEVGFRVISRPTGSDAATEAATETGANVRATTRTVVVLSRAYLRSAEYRVVREQVSALDPVGTRRLVVPIGVGGPPVTNPFPTHATADLDQLDEAAARQAVFRVLEVETPPPPPADDGDRNRARYPGSNPPVWDVPTRNAAFTGRTKILEDLRDQLRQRGSATLLQVLHGLGGVGKTQIALEYAHRFKHDYDIVWWIPAEEPNRVAQSLADLAEPLGIRSTDVAEASASVVSRLRSGGPNRQALLVFDNAVAEQLPKLERYIPSGGAAHVILTSRDRELAASLGTAPVDVNVFSRAESVEHLRRQVPGLSEGDADQLAETLGDLPIMVEMAAAWLKETGIPVGDYIARLAAHPTVVLGETPATYREPIAAVWHATIEQLRMQSPAAVRLLEVCAFFGPEPISTTLIYSDQFVETLRRSDPLLSGERMMIDRLIRDLGRFALARVDRIDQSIQIHRLLQALVQDSLSADQQEEMRRTVRRILARIRPVGGDVDDPTYWKSYRIIWPHLYACGADQTDEGETRQLMVERVRYLATRGQIDAALDLGQRMMAIWTAGERPDEMWALVLGCEVANCLRQRGRAEESLRLDEDVYDRQRHMLGPDHLHTLRTAGSLSADLRSLGRWREALERDRETYAILMERYGDDHPRTLWAANNLAVSLRINGDPYEALHLDQTVYDRRKEMLGRGHFFTLSSAINLGRDLRDCGQYRDARGLLQVTVNLCQDELGTDSPATLHALKGLAVAERKAGNHARARELTEQAYEKFRIVFRDHAPETLACDLNLACDQSAVGDKRGALARASEVMDRYRAQLGARHPHTLVAANNVSIYRRTTGDVDGAVALAGETYDALTQALGADHPFTLSAAMNLANARLDRGDMAGALELMQATEEKLRRVLRARHPDTLASAANRAVALQRAGRAADAEALQAETLEVLREVHGDDHHDVRMLAAWQLLNRDLEPHQT